MVGLAAASALALGCASAPQEPLLLPPVTVTATGPSPEGQQAPAASSPRVPAGPAATVGGKKAEDRNPPEDADDPTLVVLGAREQSAPGTNREMLHQAARGARDTRDRSGVPVLVLTDENLSEHAEGGRVTLGLADPPELTDTTPEQAALAEKEAYWRDRVLDIRRRWREAHDSLEPLEAEAAKLRTRFYSEDDPVRRDREIKPQWDRTLDRISEAQKTLTTARDELDEALEEGRHDSALPGWLREGIELGPFDLDEPAEGEQLDELSPSEPSVVEPQSLEPPA